MIYRRNLIDIIRDQVEAMTFPVTITDQTTNADGSITLLCCDIYHAQPSRHVTIGGNDYKIVSIDDVSSTITVTGTVVITATTFNLYTPFFFSESPINIDNTLKAIPLEENKTPMVYMLLKYSEDYDDDEFEELNVERKSTFTLYFLTQSYPASWLIGDFMTNAVKPMERLMQNFEQQLKNNIKMFDMVDARNSGTVNPRFGVYINNKGDLKSYTADDLSGTQMDFNLNIFRDRSCHCEVADNLTDESFETFTDENNEIITA